MASPPNTNIVNASLTHHTYRGRERTQLQSRNVLPALTMKNTTSIFSQDSQSDHLIRSNLPFGRETGNNTQIAAVVTPSPKSKGNWCNEKVLSSQKLDTAGMTFVESQGTWRKHGKLFRASIVLADEDNGGNLFALSDSCAIERYYRVADRVLEQFLSSNIAERNELVETYIVGNRLFKFLSVVLPTHHYYFSSDPRLEELRNCSEFQLMQLLQYMEELELMIDEMEYNRYILKDLTPSEAKDNMGGGNITTDKIPQEDWVADGNFFHEFSERKRIDNRENNNIIIAAKPKMSTQHKQARPSEKQQQKQPQQNVAHHLDESNDAYGKFQGGSVKVAVQAIEASNQTQKHKKSNIIESPNHHLILKRRVAAVVKASSSAEISTNFRRSIQSISSGVGGLDLLSSSNIENKCLDYFPDMNHMEFQDFSQNDFNFQGLHEVPKKLTEREQREEDKQPLHKSSGGPQMSWDADFSHFNVFSSKKIQGEAFTGSKPKNTNIDLLLRDTCPLGKMESECPKPLPKIKEPPLSHPYSVWGHGQVHAAQLSSSFEGHELNTNEHNTEVPSVLSDCSSDIFYSLEDPGPEPESVITKIEERLKRAKHSQDNPTGNKSVPFTVAQYENSSVLEANSHRKLLNQFRGCMKFLLD